MTEILAPAGDEKSAYAAINAGADAVYLGLSAFSARSGAENFGYEALEKLIAYAHFLNVKIYVAMNTLVKDSELEEFISAAVKVHNIGADAIIIQDIYLGAYLKKNYPQMCLHLSTQAGVCNVYGAQYAKQLGFSRVILARETKLADIAEIAKIIETEAFVQGALCTCFSGQCYLSSFAGGNSGNRGKCKQPCRKKYSINRSGFEEYAYRLSLSDLCVGEDISALIKAGVSSFKIEGRMRRPEYVSAAVNYYKNLLEGKADKEDWSALKRTYNRGNYTKGLAFGQDKSFISSAVQGHIGEYLGAVTVEGGKYVCRSSAVCGVGDGFKILRGGKEVAGAVFGEKFAGGFTLKSSKRLKNGDKVFITTDVRLKEKLLDVNRVKKLKISARFAAGEKPQITVNGSIYMAEFIAQAAQGRPICAEDIIKCFNKTDLYPVKPVYGDIYVGDNTFVPVSLLNAFRRDVYAAVYNGHCRNGREIIDKCLPFPLPQKDGLNRKTAVIASNLKGVNADIGIFKPYDYTGGINELCNDFNGEKFVYLPPFLSGEDVRRIKPFISSFDGIYSGGNYAVLLAKELNLKLFAGTGFNIFNALSLSLCPADYIALSKEISAAEAKRLSRGNTFYLTAGDVKVMDFIYCPFQKTCGQCDKRRLYTLTDENKREFILYRYATDGSVGGGCRFELYNCARLVSENSFTGRLYDFSSFENAANVFEAISDVNRLKTVFKTYTKGHTDSPVL